MTKNYLHPANADFKTDYVPRYKGELTAHMKSAHNVGGDGSGGSPKPTGGGDASSAAPPPSDTPSAADAALLVPKTSPKA